MEAGLSTLDTRRRDGGSEALIEVRDLQTHYSVRGSFVDRLRGRESGSVAAVDGVSFDLRHGEVFGLVGESGSGKTTLGRTLLGLVEATKGSIKLRGEEITGLSEAEMRPLRRRLQIVFQDPHASLNPAMTIGAAIGDPLRFHGIADGKAERERLVAEALERVGLAPASQFADKYPTDLSGGQKQRAVLARAIILGPDILVADEPVSMLDMSVRAKILELMIELKSELDLTYVYITHDLATAKFFCDRIAIMYLGRIVELGPAEKIYADPKHPYTQSLLRAIPEPDPTPLRAARPASRRDPRRRRAAARAAAFTPAARARSRSAAGRAGDLRAALEERWTQIPEYQYEGERELIGDLDSLDQASFETVFHSAGGHSGENAERVLAAMRGEMPDDPHVEGRSRRRRWSRTASA